MRERNYPHLYGMPNDYPTPTELSACLPPRCAVVFDRQLDQYRVILKNHGTAKGLCLAVRERATVLKWRPHGRASVMGSLARRRLRNLKLDGGKNPC